MWQSIFRAERGRPKHELEAGGQRVLQATSSAKSPKTMNTEIQRGLVHSATLLTPNSPLQGKVGGHFLDDAPARTFSEQSAVTPSTNLDQGGQQVLQATSSAKSPKTMNTEIQRGLVQSAMPLAPNGPLQGKVDDQFCSHAPAGPFFERSAVIQIKSLKQGGSLFCRQQAQRRARRR